MDIGWLVQALQTGSPILAAGGTLRTSEEGDGSAFEGLVNPEIETISEAEPLLPIWPSVTLLPQMPMKAMPAEAEDAVVEGGLPQAGDDERAVSLQPDTLLTDQIQREKSLPEAQGTTLEVAKAQVPLPTQASAVAPVAQAQNSPPTEDQSIALTPEPMAKDQHIDEVAAIPADVRSIAKAPTLPMTPGYWRMVLEGGMDRIEPLEGATPIPSEPITRAESPDPAGKVLADPSRLWAAPAEGLPTVMPQFGHQGAAERDDPPHDKVSVAMTTISPRVSADLSPPPSMIEAPQLLAPQQEAISLPAFRAEIQALAAGDKLLGSGFLTLTASDGSAMPVRVAAVEQIQAESGQEITEIRLDPEELGRLRITLEGEGEALRVRVEVERPETLDLLRRNGERLAETLREAGYEQAGMQFGTWSGERRPAAPTPEATFDPEPEPSNLSPLSSLPSSRPVGAVAGLNLRL